MVQSLPCCDLICYIDFMAYDETPVQTRVVEPNPGGNAFKQWKESDMNGGDLASNDPCWEVTVSTDSVHNKVLQVRQLYALIFRTPFGYCKLYGENLCPLVALENGSALVLSEALSRTSATTWQSDAFKLRTRVCSMDSAPANLLTESCISASRGEKWKTLQNGCEVHTTARAFRKTFDGLMPLHVSSIIHIALALRSGTSMISFRRCLGQEIREKLKLYYGPIPDAATRLRQQLLQLFWTAGSKLLLQRVVLSRLPNGLWSDRKEVQVYVPLTMRGHVTRENVSRTVVSALTYVLTGCKPHLFPRHRWTGSDLSVEDLGRLECIHYLLSATWARFMNAHSKISKAPSPNTSSGGPAGDSNSTIGMGQASGLSDPSLSHAISEGDREVEASGVHIERARGAQEHAQDRQKGDQWITSGSHSPLSILIMLRMAMQPLVMLLNCQLDIVLLDWELKQQASLSKHLGVTTSSEEVVLHRHYQATISAQGILENQFFKSLQGLFTKEWGLIEEHQRSVSTRALAFQILSRQGALIYVGLSVPHQRYPMALFKLLHEPSLGPTLYEDARRQTCMLDEWTHEMVRLVPWI